MQLNSTVLEIGKYMYIIIILLLPSGGQDSFGNVNCPSVKFRTAKNLEWREIQNKIVDVDASDILRPNYRRTRGQQRLYQSRATPNVYKFSFYPHTIHEWNLQVFFVICVTQPGVLSVVVADESSRSSLHLV
jgi:hypothetical protein